MSTNDPTPVTVTWLGEWDRHGSRETRRAYMDSELSRIEAEGAPLLHAVLSCPLEDMQDLGVLALKERGYSPMLKLRDGYVAWPKDPNGRDMPEAQRGKALCCKVGVYGQMDRADLAARNDETKRFTGPARQALLRTPGGLYRTRNVTHKATPVPLEDAIVIMRQWGVGLTPKRFYKKNTMDRWAVEEVPQVEAPSAPTAEPRKRAA